jgi:hypothetical protein
MKTFILVVVVFSLGFTGGWQWLKYQLPAQMDVMLTAAFNSPQGLQYCREVLTAHGGQ